MASVLVLGYDRSDGAKAALDKAVELAKLDGSRIAVVFGSEIPAAYGGETGDYRRAVRRLGEEAVGGGEPSACVPPASSATSSSFPSAP